MGFASGIAAVRDGGGVLRVCFALLWEPKSEDQEIENGMEWSG